MGLNVENPAQNQPQFVVLELSKYKRYTREGQLYVSHNEVGQRQHYKFTLAQAMILLQEQDPNDYHPIWRRPVPERQIVQKQIDLSKPAVQDVTTDRVKVMPMTERHPDDPSVQPIMDGTEEEFAALGLGDPPGEQVQV